MANRDKLSVQAFLDAFAKGDAQAMEALMTPDFVLRQADGLPYGGVYRGAEGWRQFLLRLGQTWSSLVPGRMTLVGEGPQFGVMADISLTSRATGKALNTSVFELWTMRDGKLAEIRPFYWDTAAVAAITAREASASDPAADARRRSSK